MTAMIGERIRELRQAQGRSLADVAGKAKISVATLSRIENDKQSIELGLFLQLARVLDISPAEFLAQEDAKGANGGNVDPLARRIATLETKKRTELWREVAAERRSIRVRSRGAAQRDVGQQVEELLAQVDFMREELETMRRRIKSKR